MNIKHQIKHAAMEIFGLFVAIEDANRNMLYNMIAFDELSFFIMYMYMYIFKIIIGVFKWSTLCQT